MLYVYDVSSPWRDKSLFVLKSLSKKGFHQDVVFSGLKIPSGLKIGTQETKQWVFSMFMLLIKTIVTK